MTDLQKCILEIFKETKKILDSHHIDYYAIGGTCIGAVRHQGFIPWDDDLDIAVPIEQFDKLIKFLELELPDYLKIYSCKEHKSFRYIFLKVIDTRTTFIEESEKNFPADYKGVYIDIMPIGGIPTNLRQRRKFANQQRFCLRMNEKLRADKEANSIAGKCANVLSQIVENKYGYSYFSEQWINHMKRYPMKESRFTGYTWWPFQWEKFNQLTFETKWFLETVDLPFEDTVIKCPLEYDEVLSKQFGNYMEFPPEEEREGHHYGVVDLNKSFKEYQLISGKEGEH